MVDAHGLTADDVVLMPAPLAHISGLLNGVLVPGAAGMRSIFMERWDPEDALATIEREGVTFMIGPPTFFVGLMGASAVLPPTGRVLATGVVGRGRRHARLRGGGDRRARCRGQALVRILGGADDHHLTRRRSRPSAPHGPTGASSGAAELRIAADGELLVQGPELFAGYLDAAQTREVVTRGWFHTGDLATLDDGWLTIVGRKKDVIIRGGENIAASEVERVTESHPSVRAAVAVAEPDERLGERVCVFVVTDPDAPTFDLVECRRWFEHSGIARFKTPERVEIVSTLPTLAAGKVDRAALRARL